MNRLTRKHKHTNYTRYTEKTICLKNYNIRNANLNKVIEKLGKFEDFQEELDCPLEVMFKALKALKESIIYFDNDMYSVDFCLENNSGTWFFSIYDISTNNKDIVYLKDYGKTWWLKGEKENE